jgi:hypothetical protein
MRPRIILAVAMAGIIPLIALTPAAWGINSKAGTAAYTFLKIGTGAKSQALGGAFVGLSDDATALYYNPAGLSARGENTHVFDDETEGISIKPVSDNRFTASYINYLLDFQYGFIGFVRQIDSSTAAGMSISYQNYGSFNRLDRDGTNLGTFGASDFAVGLTYSKRITPRISAGVTGKFVYEKVDTYSSNGLGADAGFMYLINEEGTTRLGLALTNLGAQLRGLTSAHKDKLPTKVAAGISHQMVGLPLLFSAEIGKPFDNDFYGSLGAEFIKLNPFFLRLGWTTQGRDWKTGAGNDALGGFSGGFGVIFKTYAIDYSYSSYADLGSVHRVSLGAGF